MTSTIWYYYFTKIRVLLLRKFKYTNIYNIPYVKSVSVDLEANFFQNSNFEKKKILLLIELITGRKPKVIVIKSEDSITRNHYIITFNAKDSLFFLYRFSTIILPQLRFFRGIALHTHVKDNYCLFSFKDPAIFYEITSKFELFPNYESIKNFQLKIHFSTTNKLEIAYLLSLLKIPYIFI
jgi:ribosomal protein L5